MATAHLEFANAKQDAYWGNLLSPYIVLRSGFTIFFAGGGGGSALFSYVFPEDVKEGQILHILGGGGWGSDIGHEHYNVKYV